MTVRFTSDGVSRSDAIRLDEPPSPPDWVVEGVERGDAGDAGAWLCDDSDFGTAVLEELDQ